MGNGLRKEKGMDIQNIEWGNRRKNIEGEKGGRVDNSQFLEAIQKASRWQEAVPAEKRKEAGSIDKDKMTLEEYKQYLDEKIKSLNIHPSWKNTFLYVSITQDAYIRMKENPDYEEAVLKRLAKDLGQQSYLPGWEPDYIVFEIGKNMEDYKTTQSYPRNRRNIQEDYLEYRKAKRKKELKLWQEKLFLKQYKERIRFEKLTVGKKLAEKERYEQLAEDMAMLQATGRTKDGSSMLKTYAIGNHQAKKAMGGSISIIRC